MNEVEQLKADNAYLREALEAIASPVIEGVAFTSDASRDNYHRQQMQIWIDKHYNSETTKIYVLSHKSGTDRIAEQALKGTHEANQKRTD